MSHELDSENNGVGGPRWPTLLICLGIALNTCISITSSAREYALTLGMISLILILGVAVWACFTKRMGQ